MCNIKTASERLQSFMNGDEFSKLKQVEDLSLKHSRFVAQRLCDAALQQDVPDIDVLPENKL